MGALWKGGSNEISGSPRRLLDSQGGPTARIRDAVVTGTGKGRGPGGGGGCHGRPGVTSWGMGAGVSAIGDSRPGRPPAGDLSYGPSVLLGEPRILQRL